MHHINLDCSPLSIAHQQTIKCTVGARKFIYLMTEFCISADVVVTK